MWPILGVCGGPGTDSSRAGVSRPHHPELRQRGSVRALGGSESGVTPSPQPALSEARPIHATVRQAVDRIDRDVISGRRGTTRKLRRRLGDNCPPPSAPARQACRVLMKRLRLPRFLARDDHDRAPNEAAQTHDFHPEVLEGIRTTGRYPAAQHGSHTRRR
jgi:hypothetical protein